MKYRFLGDTASLYHEGGVIEFHSFGQSVELSDEQAAHLLAKNLLLPEDEFARIGFSEEHLKEFPSAVSHSRAPEAFRQRKLQALKRAHELNGVSAPADSAVVESADSTEEAITNADR